MSYEYDRPDSEKKKAMQWPEALVVSTLLICVTIIISQII